MSATVARRRANEFSTDTLPLTRLDDGDAFQLEFGRRFGRNDVRAADKLTGLRGVQDLADAQAGKDLLLRIIGKPEKRK